jgi:hypothetical protein
MVKDGWMSVVTAALLVAAVLPRLLTPQTQAGQAPGIYARLAIMRALDGDSLDWEAGHIRHLEWHRQPKDPFACYRYSVWASTEPQRWMICVAFGYTAAELSNPVSAAEDESDSLIKPLPNSQLPGNRVYQFLPALSRGNDVPTPSARAEYTTVDLNYGTGRAFEAVLAAEQPKRQGETL